MCGRYFPRLARQYSVQRPTAPDPEGTPVAALIGPFGCHQFLGDPSEEDPPVPIPNTAVKLLSPDGTARASVWESRTSPGLIPRPPLKREAFSFPPANRSPEAAHELHVFFMRSEERRVGKECRS